MLVILGCGGHGRSIADVFLNYCEASSKKASFCFVDSNAKNEEKIFGQPVYSDLPMLRENDTAILAIGDNASRKKVFERHRNLPYISLIAFDATVGTKARIGQGCFVAHRAYIGPECALGIHSIINTGAIVEHECQIGDFSHIAPGSVVAGRTRIGNCVFLGAGTVVGDHITIADDIVVGAGAVVTRDLKEPGIYVGVPARKIRCATVGMEIK